MQVNSYRYCGGQRTILVFLLAELFIAFKTVRAEGPSCYRWGNGGPETTRITPGATYYNGFNRVLQKDMFKS